MSTNVSSSEVVAPQDQMIMFNGDVFVYHNIVFEEEVIPLMKDKLQETGNLVQIKPTPSVNTEAFIKFFREKYRLCWKEIYLKFSALMKKAEQCINCR